MLVGGFESGACVMGKRLILLFGVGLVYWCYLNIYLYTYDIDPDHYVVIIPEFILYSFVFVSL